MLCWLTNQRLLSHRLWSVRHMLLAGAGTTDGMLPNQTVMVVYMPYNQTQPITAYKDCSRCLLMSCFPDTPHAVVQKRL